MLDALLNSVLPVFAVLGVGMLFAQLRLFDISQAQAINRYVFYVGLPALAFRLLARSHPDQFDWPLLGAYAVSELVIYVAGMLLFRVVMKKSMAESFLLGLALILCNHVFYVLPIGIAAFGDVVAPQIIGMIFIDVLVFFNGTVVAMEILQALDSGHQDRHLAGHIAIKLISNPQVLAALSGVAAMLIAIPLDNGLGTFLDFVGDSAAPASLFALGVILMLHPAKSGWGLVTLITLVNLVLMPLVMFAVLFGLGNFDVLRATPALLVAAGPVGAMPFVLSVQYGHDSGIYARAVLITTLLSVISLSAIIGWVGTQI
ncbi:MAG: AEC family transporter [Hyphomicrobiaceae bacterium]|nr:AEC family transporter [Hyphomicrobiaceae bacterium]MCC0024330.1 AEC family transporter [Hyphomicrobiaceae bacterium]